MTIPIEAILDKYGCDYNPDKGGNQQIKCPFHEDSHASASVNLDKGLFNCYGCGVAGDAIELLIANEGLDYLEAKRTAEELAGGSGRAVSPEPDTRDRVLPRKSGHRPNRRQWISPWASRGR